jgi:N-methylhydantoinase B
MSDKEQTVDAVSLELFRSGLTAIAEEMGVVLTRSSYSPNIKERRDFSCALFDAQGRLVAQAAHIPVHLGSMPDSVMAALAVFERFEQGDVIAVNDPFLGGTHLPDITLIAPIHSTIEGEEKLVGFAANRAHHADVGGMSPGSMPMATEIYQEGVIIPPTRLWEAGRPNQSVLNIVLRNLRTPDERRGDLAAQMAANRTGMRRVQELIERWKWEHFATHIDGLIAYAERIARATIQKIPDGCYRFTDYLDNDGVSGESVQITCAVTVSGDEMKVDFTGSAEQTRGNVNTVEAVAKSATYYVARCLMPDDAPMNYGTFVPVKVIAPKGSVVNARPPAAVAQGNVETSQRITDVVFGALASALPEVIPAASQGTMNNISAGGVDPRTGRAFAYYETMGGGMGARPHLDGLSGVHTHMSNTLNTPVEAFEYAYPMRIGSYRLRDRSGGDGEARGGDGLEREIIFEVPTEVTLLTERRVGAPYGLQGGLAGRQGENRLWHEGDEQILPGKIHFRASVGDRLRIASPGGGGWGERKDSERMIEAEEGK